MAFRTMEWIGAEATLRLLDQRFLPEAVQYRDLATPEAVAGAIRDMTVRGAPAIGVSAAFGIAQAALLAEAAGRPLIPALEAADGVLRASRPTAVNLFWALDRMAGLWRAGAGAARLLDEAVAMEREDIACTRRLRPCSGHPAAGGDFFHIATRAPGGGGVGRRWDHPAAIGGRKLFAFWMRRGPGCRGRSCHPSNDGYGVPHAIVVDGHRPIYAAAAGGYCRGRLRRVAANGDTANRSGL